jgi:hypothetical protein
VTIAHLCYVQYCTNVKCLYRSHYSFQSSCGLRIIFCVPSEVYVVDACDRFLTNRRCRFIAISNVYNIQPLITQVLQVVRYIYIWLERKCFKLHSELLNVFQSNVSDELLKKNFVGVLHILWWWFNTQYFKENSTEILKTWEEMLGCGANVCTIFHHSHRWWCKLYFSGVLVFRGVSHLKCGLKLFYQGSATV